MKKTTIYRHFHFHFSELIGPREMLEVIQQVHFPNLFDELIFLEHFLLNWSKVSATEFH